ncbi:hypothetical protein FD14_GL001037 [Secundilactobacillus similis DSM 23365 = JCM 2765]|uniref:Chromosome segregation ATPase n=1 Tax=Secundilactobacillus similis DSM 23365 = JCM 2765 TaxID=1423804 RepID=A0A0R2EYX9_9LACO|nr:hypothetical protein FD14_GL001037 [Secundilactobacillus similis DSM 23365 = JCM 2765]
MDITPAQNGNFALVGHNGVGKTNLVNCFIPLLINGSRSTPAFNTANEMEKLGDTSSAQRNSSRHMRTFEGTVLGEVNPQPERLGYTYITLQSNQRMVVLGLGTQVYAGNPSRTKVWYFVLEADNLTSLEPITLVDGHHPDPNHFVQALAETDFITENQRVFGNRFHSFDSADEYAEYVARNVFGLPLTDLNTLTRAYQILMTPNLISGANSISPVQTALSSVQDKLNEDIIHSMIKAHDDQKNYQFKKQLYAELLSGSESNHSRLFRLHKTMHALNEAYLIQTKWIPYRQQLAHHSALKAENGQQQLQLNQLLQQLTNHEQQLKEQSDQLDQYTQQLNDQKQASEILDVLGFQKEQILEKVVAIEEKMNLIVEQRHQIEKLTTTKQALSDQLSTLKSKMTQSYQKLLTLLKPFKHLQSRSSFASSIEFTQNLAQYLDQLRVQRRQLSELQLQWQRAFKYSHLFTDTQDQMASKIDQIIQNHNNLYHALQQANQTIHQQGLATIDHDANQILHEIKSVQANYPDVRIDQQQLDQVDTQISTISTINTEIDQVNTEFNTISEQLTTSLAAFDKSNATDLNHEKKQLQEKLIKVENSVTHFNKAIDAQLPQKIKEVQNVIDNMNLERDDLKAKIAIQTENQQQLHADLKSTTEKLDRFTADMQKFLKHARPWLTESLTDFIALQEKRAEKSISEYVRQIEKLKALTQTLIKPNRDSADPLTPQNRSLNELLQGIGMSELAIVAGDLVFQDEQDVYQLNFDLPTLKANVKKHVPNDQTHLLATDELGTFCAAVSHQMFKQRDYLQQINQTMQQNNERADIKFKIELDYQRSNRQGNHQPVLTETALTEIFDINDTKMPEFRSLMQHKLEFATRQERDDLQTWLLEEFDYRNWSTMNILVKLPGTTDYRILTNPVLKTKLSSAQKTHATLIPLLIIVKIILDKCELKDAPRLLFLDDFAGRLDDENAQRQLDIVAAFDFSLITTRPGNDYSTLLADNIENTIYQVQAGNSDGGVFPINTVSIIGAWHR